MIKSRQTVESVVLWVLWVRVALFFRGALFLPDENGKW
jgi:hypothetical protein